MSRDIGHIRCGLERGSGDRRARGVRGWAKSRGACPELALLFGAAGAVDLDDPPDPASRGADHAGAAQATPLVLCALPGRARPNEMWQSDFIHWRLADGSDAEVLNWLDDHSCYLLSCTAYEPVTGEVVVAVFLDAVGQHGAPVATLTNNGDEHHITVTDLTTGEVLGRHLIEPDKGYWRNQNKQPGRWPSSHNRDL